MIFFDAAKIQIIPGLAKKYHKKEGLTKTRKNSHAVREQKHRLFKPKKMYINVILDINYHIIGTLIFH